MDPTLNTLSATAAAAAMARGETSSSALLEACLDRIETRDALVSAWVYVDAELALAKARAADDARAAGKPLGPLHGLPIAIKDIFDTGDMPTECGSALYRGRRPTEDAQAVSLLRRAGAIVIGKTVTAELALSAPGATANPLDLRRTPGGSSSGSAAAVADHMVPLAVGSQTGGSVIRPASYCGIVGFKPSFGAIPTGGMHLLAEPLDHAGVFARDVADIALMAKVMMAAGLGAQDSATAHSPGRPRIGVLRAPVWREASDDARARFDVWADSLDMYDGVELGDIFDDAVACQRLILDANLAGNFGAVLQTKPEALKAMTRERVVAGLAIGAKAVSSALSRVEEQRTRLGQVFEDYDALLTLAAPGEAPLGLSSTGDAVFSVIWTLMGVPAITLPMLVGEDGLPIGIQLIGARGEDAKLLAIAAQIIERA
ncbi:MAG: amidase [Gammaproteobacteria bacterium]|nr:amidase [Gammaproteobacteria bacterium]MDX2461573.1 amidase [Gammaproteobacteria bacterium]